MPHAPCPLFKKLEQRFVLPLETHTTYNIQGQPLGLS